VARLPWTSLRRVPVRSGPGCFPGVPIRPRPLRARRRGCPGHGTGLWTYRRSERTRQWRSLPDPRVPVVVSRRGRRPRPPRRSPR
jgi:hypothetical protein